MLMAQGYPDHRRGHIGAPCAMLLAASPAGARSSTHTFVLPQALALTRPLTTRDATSGTTDTGQVERPEIAPPGRKDDMLSRTPNAPASLSRRTLAQRRLRRAAPHRLFCSTNGCTTFLVPDDSRRARGLPSLRPAADIPRLTGRRRPFAARTDARRAHEGPEEPPRSGIAEDDLTTWGRTLALETSGRTSGRSVASRSASSKRRTVRCSWQPARRTPTGPRTWRCSPAARSSAPVSATSAWPCRSPAMSPRTRSGH